MSKIVLLRDLLLENEHACELFINYRPNTASVSIAGYSLKEKEKTITTESKLAWHSFLYDGQVCVISDPTEFKLPLAKRGESTMQAIIMKQRMCASVYASSEFGTKPMPIKRTDFEVLPRFLKNTEGSYWLEDSTMFAWIESHKSDLSKVMEMAQIKNVVDYTICLTEGGDLVRENSIRVIVQLPPSVKVSMDNPEREGSSQKNALELFL